MNLGLWNTGIRLAGLSDDDLMKLSRETGIAYPMLKSQQRAEMASTGNNLPAVSYTHLTLPTILRV